MVTRDEWADAVQNYYLQVGPAFGPAATENSVRRLGRCNRAELAHQSFSHYIGAIQRRRIPVSGEVVTVPVGGQYCSANRADGRPAEPPFGN